MRIKQATTVTNTKSHSSSLSICAINDSRLNVFEGLVYVRYLDHVVFQRSVAEKMAPQHREAIGWLVYECDLYVIVRYDRDARPPTLKGGDTKASGLVLLKAVIEEIIKLPIQQISQLCLNSASSTDTLNMRSNKRAKNSQKRIPHRRHK
ncbi:MAG: hypothetical protein LBE76_08135 [Nitrososphaerota archaeon]|jgi:hypothetical protein|nr:hypothetical protein [Nitrososphaerota archaeon]